MRTWARSNGRLVRRIGAGLAVFALLDVAAVSLASSTSDSRPQSRTRSRSGPSPSSDPPRPPRSAPRRHPLAPQPLPTKISIPTVKVSSRLVDLHVTDGELAVPKDYSKAGWWTEGIIPGQAGPAVIVGHVDSTKGAAVFYRTRQLKPGDTIDITREDGSVITFKVDAVRQVSKAKFPTRDIYGPTPVPTLRLITCGGKFDRAERHYEDNVVVFATLVSAPPPDPSADPRPGALRMNRLTPAARHHCLRARDRTVPGRWHRHLRHPRHVVPPVRRPTPASATATAGSGATIDKLQRQLDRVPNDYVSWASLGLAYVQQARITVNPDLYTKAEAALQQSSAAEHDDNYIARCGYGRPRGRPSRLRRRPRLGEQGPRDQPVELDAVRLAR